MLLKRCTVGLAEGTQRDISVPNFITIGGAHLKNKTNFGSFLLNSLLVFLYHPRTYFIILALLICLLQILVVLSNASL